MSSWIAWKAQLHMTQGLMSELNGRNKTLRLLAVYLECTKYYRLTPCPNIWIPYPGSIALPRMSPFSGTTPTLVFNTRSNLASATKVHRYMIPLSRANNHPFLRVLVCFFFFFSLLANPYGLIFALYLLLTLAVVVRVTLCLCFRQIGGNHIFLTSENAMNNLGYYYLKQNIYSNHIT
jgi:hypothetical protein